MTAENKGYAGVGCGIGFLLFLAVALLNGDLASISAMNNAKSECEAPLPRGQHCKIIAIPEVTK